MPGVIDDWVRATAATLGGRFIATVACELDEPETDLGTLILAEDELYFPGVS